VILAKTVKGFGLGKAGEGLNSAHQQKKLGDEALKEVRDRFNIQISDEEIAGSDVPQAAPDSEEMKYFLERRAALGGYLPARTDSAPRWWCRRSKPSVPCSKAPVIARFPPPWRWCAC
jgi:pyruvate dehydrogenase E1 component